MVCGCKGAVRHLDLSNRKGLAGVSALGTVHTLILKKCEGIADDIKSLGGMCRSQGVHLLPVGSHNSISLTTFPIFYAIFMRNHRIIIENVVAGPSFVRLLCLLALALTLDLVLAFFFLALSHVRACACVLVCPSPTWIRSFYVVHDVWISFSIFPHWHTHVPLQACTCWT